MACHILKRAKGRKTGIQNCQPTLENRFFFFGLNLQFIKLRLQLGWSHPHFICVCDCCVCCDFAGIFVVHMSACVYACLFFGCFEKGNTCNYPKVSFVSQAMKLLLGHTS